MEEQLISFETAKLAKEKKFNIPCENFYIEYIDDDVADLFNYEEQRGSGYAELYRNNQEFKYSASTQSLLQKWLREVHNCFIDILPHRDGDSKNKQWKSKKDVFWSVEVDYYGKDFKIELTDDADFTQHFNKTYEEALEIGLYQALKLIK